MKEQLWETRPLEFWKKAKELRAGWQDSISSKKDVVAQGNTYAIDWSPAFPAVKLIEDNPAGAMMQAKYPRFASKCRLASEIRGWGREICGYQNNCWGAQFLGYEGDGSPFRLRQMVIPMPAVCDLHAKRGQQCRDYSALPQWMADQCMYFGEFDGERNAPMLEHNVYCNLKMINDIERIFGQHFDEEELIKLINDSRIIIEYAKEISLYMANTKPSPLSVKDLYSVYTIGGLTKVNPDATVAFWKLVRDEVKWRAENQIAAVGNECFRWIEAHPPSWHFLKYYRYMERYGAVCMGSQYTHLMSGNLEYKPDGSIGNRDESTYPKDMPINTREDALRVMVGTDARKPDSYTKDEYIRRDSIVEFAKIMQADGALLPLWRSGVGCTLTRKEQAMRLRDAGLSVIHYEGSQCGDRTDMDEKRLIEQLDSWMQSLGIRNGQE